MEVIEERRRYFATQGSVAYALVIHEGPDLMTRRRRCRKIQNSRVTLHSVLAGFVVLLRPGFPPAGKDFGLQSW